MPCWFLRTLGCKVNNLHWSCKRPSPVKVISVLIERVFQLQQYRGPCCTQNYVKLPPTPQFEPKSCVLSLNILTLLALKGAFFPSNQCKIALHSPPYINCRWCGNYNSNSRIPRNFSIVGKFCFSFSSSTTLTQHIESSTQWPMSCDEVVVPNIE